MSTSDRRVSGYARSPADGGEAPAPRSLSGDQEGRGSRQLAMGDGSGGSAGPGGARRHRRHQRPQRGKQRRPVARSMHLEGVSRERAFQELEGLLRQIREQAEESENWAEDRLNEITQAVTSFTKTLEEHVDPIPERVRMEFHRVREKLSQVLKG